MTNKEIIIRRAVADYMMSEGCGCCEGDNHEDAKKRLAELLDVPPFADGSGYDFNRFASDSVKVATSD